MAAREISFTIKVLFFLLQLRLAASVYQSTCGGQPLNTACHVPPLSCADLVKTALAGFPNPEQATIAACYAYKASKGCPCFMRFEGSIDSDAVSLWQIAIFHFTQYTQCPDSITDSQWYNNNVWKDQTWAAWGWLDQGGPDCDDDPVGVLGCAAAGFPSGASTRAVTSTRASTSAASTRTTTSHAATTRSTTTIASARTSTTRAVTAATSASRTTSTRASSTAAIVSTSARATSTASTAARATSTAAAATRAMTTSRTATSTTTSRAATTLAATTVVGTSLSTLSTTDSTTTSAVTSEATSLTTGPDMATTTASTEMSTITGIPLSSPPTSTISDLPLCVTDPPPNGICVGGAWWIPSLEVDPNVTWEPWIVGADVKFSPRSTTTVKPTDNTTIFVIVQGIADVDGSLMIDLSGKTWDATYTVLSILRADSIVGGYATVGITNSKKPCEQYSAWTSQGTTSLNGLLLRDDSACHKSYGVGQWGVILGAVAFGLAVVILGVLVVLVKWKVIRPSTYVMLAREKNQTGL